MKNVTYRTIPCIVGSGVPLAYLPDGRLVHIHRVLFGNERLVLITSDPSVFGPQALIEVKSTVPTSRILRKKRRGHH